MNLVKNINFKILTLTLLFFTIEVSAVSRIENFNVDRKKVNKIYLSFSKASIIRFPFPIEEVRLGLPNFYSSEVSKTYSRELTLFLSSDSNNPSNLIVRTSDESLYAFDLVPSKYNHQDIVFVDESFYSTMPRIASSLKSKDNKRILLFQKSKPIKIYSNQKSEKL